MQTSPSNIRIQKCIYAAVFYLLTSILNLTVKINRLINFSVFKCITFDRDLTIDLRCANLETGVWQDDEDNTQAEGGCRVHQIDKRWTASASMWFNFVSRRPDFQCG